MTPRHSISLFLLSVSTFTLTSANYFSLGSAHSITNLQTSLGAEKKSSITSLTKNPPFLKVNGGSISTTSSRDAEEVEELLESAEDGDEIIGRGEAIGLEEATVDDTSISVNTATTAEEAATGLASPPLRISTSQMGNEIVTHHSREVKRLIRRERRSERIAKKRAMKEEVKSCKMIAKKLKVRWRWIV